MGRRYGQSDTADVVIPGPKVGMTLRLTRDVPPVVCPEPEPVVPEPPVVVCPKLEPLTWHTGETDLTFIANTEYRLEPSARALAVVIGSWPPKTKFEWAVDQAFDEENPVLIFDPATAGLAVATNGAGTLSATVTVTAPDCPAQTLGPITLTVTSSGCC